MTGPFRCDYPDGGSVSGCATCDGMLARGDLARDVPEIRYDVHGSGRTQGRYRGLRADEADALHEALGALIDLAKVWQARAQDATDEEQTSVDVLHPA